LGHAGEDAGQAQVGAEGVAEGMDIDAAAAVVGLGDPGGGQVTVEYPHEIAGHVDQRGASGQAGGNRLAILSGCRLEADQFVGEVLAYLSH
jgi:hypothetical protein